jgi:hypothetical protein
LVKYCKEHKVARHRADEHGRKVDRSLPRRILPTEGNSKPIKWCAMSNVDKDKKLHTNALIVRWPCMWTSILRHIIQKRIPGVM